MNATTLDLTADIIDVRDIIARVEELESDIEDMTETEHTGHQPTADALTEELTALRALLEELAGSGGDEQWRGDWYPVTLIRDSYFVDYATELCHDIGDIRTQDLPSYIEIDWEATARNIRMDYSRGNSVHTTTIMYRLTPTDDQFLAALGPCGR